jgi:hypothetical protein
MIITGIATTPGTAINGYFLEGGAIDCRQQSVPLFHNHERKIGEVISLSYRGDRLIATVETNDPVGHSSNFMSPAVRVIEHHNGRVRKAFLQELSILNSPVNEDCRILERRARDPMIEYTRARLKQFDLFREWTLLIGEYVRRIPDALAALSPADDPLDRPKKEFTFQDSIRLAALHERMALRHRASSAPAATSSFSSMVAELNSRMEA